MKPTIEKGQVSERGGAMSLLEDEPQAGPSAKPQSDKASGRKKKCDKGSVIKAAKSPFTASNFPDGFLTANGIPAPGPRAPIQTHPSMGNVKEIMKAQKWKQANAFKRRIPVAELRTVVEQEVKKLKTE